jgi:hypothetical protein
MRSFYCLLLCCLLLASLWGDAARADGGQVPPRHLLVASSFVGVTERGANRGPEVEMFLRGVGLGPGHAWCAAFVSYCLEVAQVDGPPVRSSMAHHRAG